MRRRTLLPLLAGAVCGGAPAPAHERVESVEGPLRPEQLGTTLMHEHVLVDFIGAEQAAPSRYDADEVFRLALPKLREVRERGCRTLVECTPAYLGRDPRLLQRLAKASGVQIVTNTGWYGANNDRHVPRLAYSETAEQMAARWTAEFRDGIEGTGIRPGFLKIGVDPGPLSEIDRKLVAAACVCHLATGLRIHVHTGNGIAAAGILEELGRRGVPASAYVWVHAQSAGNGAILREAVKAGAFLEFDGVSRVSAAAHAAFLEEFLGLGYGKQILVSQDSGWYRVGEPGGGAFHGYNYIFDGFLPLLRERGVSSTAIHQLMTANPARALCFPG